MKKREWELESSVLVRALLKKSWLIAAAAVLCALAVVLSMALMPPRYQVELVLRVDNCGTDTEITASDISASRSLVDSCISILSLRSFRERVQAEAALADMEMAEIQILGENMNGTEFLRVTVTAGDGVLAEEIARAVSTILPGQAESILAGARVRLVDAPGTAQPEPKRYVVNGVLGFALGAIVSGGAVTLWNLRRQGAAESLDSPEKASLMG